MTDCYYCNIKIADIPYRCKYCGMTYCNKHRLPENHDCLFDLRKKGKYFNSLDQTKLLYQDALDYLSKEFTVAKIYNFVTTKSMTKSEAIELLSYFIENSDNSELRKISILAFKVLELKSNRAFNVLENLLLSDEDPEVRKTVIQIIVDNFPKKSKHLINWISEHNKDFKHKKSKRVH
ncbi:MAG: AN1-type zinc finger domain-containing protein [Promethearchaeota archaeon]